LELRFESKERQIHADHTWRNPSESNNPEQGGGEDIIKMDPEKIGCENEER
jgi:hypothetical protein